ncbi:MAG TPA: cysteine synthase [Ignavibacteria bacterium]|nr:cystathionine beta-synthase [Bacteroidota bacterium]HRE11000.1 cysteine synthase [Ignavibacteria bacterium]HRF65208.1 cysteine synthase [Ignavibacteria bacterium]
MKVVNSVLELFGKTPLVKLNHITKDIKASVFAKMESMNPGASVKDRIGLAMIEDAEKRGLLKPGGTIIEATSGNTGIGLALTAAVKGYKCIFTMTEKVSVEKRRYLQALGADVVICPMTAKHDTPENYVSVAKRINADTPNSLFMYQYNNPSNPDAHYHSTGPELWEQTQGRITHFVGSLGTGGTVSGTGRYLKEKNPNIKIIAADPYGSIFKTFKESGIMTEGTPYLVEGIGQDMLPENVHFKYIDEIINITDKDSFHLSRRLGREEGIMCGGSTGTNLAAALRVAKDLDEKAVVVFVVCDTGERYLSKHHSDEWMREKRLLEKDKTTIGVVFQTKLSGGLPNMISAEPGENIGEALAKLEQYNISQIPVLDENRSVGSLTEADLMSMIIDDPATIDKKVSEVMGKAYPVIDESEDIKHGIQYLKESPAILVSQFGRLIGILTRYDVLDFI